MAAASHASPGPMKCIALTISTKTCYQSDQLKKFLRPLLLLPLLSRPLWRTAAAMLPIATS
jgi:hypothetical protein